MECTRCRHFPIELFIVLLLTEIAEPLLNSAKTIPKPQKPLETPKKDASVGVKNS